MGKKNRKWTEEEDEFLQFAFNKKLSLDEIEQALDGRTKSAIKSRILQKGLRRNAPKREKDGLLRCSHCKEYKPKNEFIQMSDGSYYYYCNTCKTLLNKEKYLKNKKQKILEQANLIFKNKVEVNDGKSTKKCSKCGIEKNVENFHWLVKGSKLSPICSECKKIVNAKYNEHSLRTRGF